MITAVFIMYWSATPNTIQIINFLEHNNLYERLTRLCSPKCVHQQRRIKNSQGGREDITCPHFAQKCTQFCCETRQRYLTWSVLSICLYLTFQCSVKFTTFIRYVSVCTRKIKCVKQLITYWVRADQKRKIFACLAAKLRSFLTGMRTSHVLYTPL